jgi:hypothetical protein
VNFYKQVKINVLETETVFYKKKQQFKKSFKSILKLKIYFKNILKEKLDIGLPKKA